MELEQLKIFLINWIDSNYTDHLSVLKGKLLIDQAWPRLKNMQSMRLIDLIYLGHADQQKIIIQ